MAAHDCMTCKFAKWRRTDSRRLHQDGSGLCLWEMSPLVPPKRMTQTARDALADKHFPKEWAELATKPGASKKRTQLRQRAERYELFLSLRERGATCATCQSYLSAPASLSFSHYCAAESDFYGYVEARADQLCYRYKGLK